MLPQVFSFADSVRELEELARIEGAGAGGMPIRGAVRRAYREIVSSHDWNYLKSNGRIQLKAALTDGTVTYDKTGGTYERQLTLAGETWPTDAEDWAVKLTTDDGNEIVCDIESRKSATVVTLDATMCPNADITAGAACTAYPRYYRLPNDFIEMDRPITETLWRLGDYVTFDRMLELDRLYNDTGSVRSYTIAAVPDLIGATAVYVNPPSATAETLDYVYKRRPREIRYVGTDSADSPGTITVVAGSAAVAGSGTTAFTAAHVGSLLRISSSTSALPTGLDGLLPYVEQRIIVAYTSAAAVTLDAAVTASAAGVKYSITDPLDISVSMYDAMMMMAKMYLAMERNWKNAAAVAAGAMNAMMRAKCADNRTVGRQICGVDLSHISRLADSPLANRPEIA